VVEDNPAQDRRTLYILEKEKGEIFVFSGKVVSAVKAARLVTQRITDGPSERPSNISKTLVP
jgi:hypothetical protein